MWLRKTWEILWEGRMAGPDGIRMSQKALCQGWELQFRSEKDRGESSQWCMWGPRRKQGGAGMRAQWLDRVRRGQQPEVWPRVAVAVVKGCTLGFQLQGRGQPLRGVCGWEMAGHVVFRGERRHTHMSGAVYGYSAPGSCLGLWQCGIFGQSRSWKTKAVHWLFFSQWMCPWRRPSNGLSSCFLILK